MDARRLRIDPFAFELGALALLTFALYTQRNGAAVIMCALCFGGLLLARLLGFSNRALVPLAGGMVILLWFLWVGQPQLGPQRTSALAHGTGGLLVGWAVSEYLRGRTSWPLWAIGAVAVVFGVSVMWELGEWFGDRAFDTALVPSKRDSAFDIAFGTLGGCAGAMLATLVPSRRAPG